TGRCTVSLIGPGLRPQNPGTGSTVDRLFKYIRQQTSLRSEVRVDTAACDANRAASVPVNAPLAPAFPHSSSPSETGSGSVSAAAAAPATSTPDTGGHSNNGFGNGGEGHEGPTETGNPGHGNHSPKPLAAIADRSGAAFAPLPVRA